MPFMNLDQEVQLYYEDEGKGTPVIFIHGVWMSSRFFQKQLPYFKNNYRTILLDLRGHGKSSKVHYGHTVAQYARDLELFMDTLELKEAVLVGWSMGAFVIWDYFKQFGESRVKASVIVDELASDFKWPDFDIGAFDFAALTGIMKAIQEDRKGFLKGFLPLMFKEEVSRGEMEWMLEETTRLPESVASAILFDQSVVDYRDTLGAIRVPTLLCFGKEEKLIPVAAGQHLNNNIPQSKLVIFKDSCHCPFLEEPDQFNRVVEAFIKDVFS